MLSFPHTDQPGKWSTSEDSVLSIREDTGVALASTAGRAVVYHNIGGVVDTLTEVGTPIVLLILTTYIVNKIYLR